MTGHGATGLALNCSPTGGPMVKRITGGMLAAAARRHGCHTLKSATSSITDSPHGRRCRQLPGTGAGSVELGSVELVDSDCETFFSANARSVVDWNRAAGAFSRHRSTIRRSDVGIGRSEVEVMVAGASRRIADIVSSVVSPAN